jgi:predicted nuclease with RNAse H fold
MTPSTRCIGVDVSLGRGQDVALIDGTRVVETWNSVGFEQLTGMLRELRPDAVGIDAPPRKGMELLASTAERERLAVPPRAGTHVRRRIAEYELSRRGIGSHQTPADDDRLFSWMTAGFQVFEAAAAAGFEPFLGEGTANGRAFEVFPYASYVALSGCLSPGRRHRLAWRRGVLDRAGVHGLSDGATIDCLDAVCAALTAVRFVDGDGCWVGDPREGAIVLPVRALQERYRRCAAPGAGPEPASAGLCECGCGAPVRRRFLPGHDAILKSRLLAAARAGDDARRHLERLGWTR